MNKNNRSLIFAWCFAAATVGVNFDVILWKWDVNAWVSDILTWEVLKTWDVVHISDPTEIAEKWESKNIFYVQWNIPVYDGALKELTQIINQKYPNTQFTFFLTWENPSNFEYKGKRWKLAINSALSDSLLKTNLGLWKKHIVFWIWFAFDNNWKRHLMILTSAEFDELWMWDRSRFSSKDGPIFLKATKQIKDNNPIEAIRILTDWYVEEYNRITTQRENNKKRAEEQHKRDLESAREWIEKIRSMYDSIVAEYREFLWKAPISGWDRDIISNIEEAESNLWNDNPNWVLSQVQNVERIIWDMEKLIRSYDSYWEQINLYWTKIKELNQSRYAYKATTKYDNADALYKKASSEWENKDFSYSNTYKILVRAHDELKSEIRNAESTAKTKNLAVGWWVWIAILLTSIFWFLSNRKRRPTKKEFEREMSKWQEALSQTRDQLSDEIKDKQEIISLVFAESKWKTKQRIEDLKQDVYMLSVIIPKLNDTLEYIRKEVWSDMWINLFRSAWYQKWLRLLSDEKISINPTIDRLDESLVELIWWDRIKTLSESASSMNFTFSWMVEEADRRIKEIRTIFDEFSESDSNFENSINSSMALKGELETSIRNLSSNMWEESTEYFPYITDFFTSFQEKVGEISSLYSSDKLWSYDLLLDVNYKLESFAKYIKEIDILVTSKNSYSNKTELKLAWYDLGWFTDWINKSYSDLWKESGNIFNPTLDGKIFEEWIYQKTNNILWIYNKLNKLFLAVRKKQQLDTSKKWLIAEVEETRWLLSSKYWIDAELLFKEEWYKPEVYFDKISELNSNVKESLDKGDVEIAEKKLEEIESILLKINKIIEITQKSFEIYDSRKIEIEDVSKNIAWKKSTANDLLKEIKETWSSEVLKLWEWDSTHPDSDWDLGNNIEEIDENQNNLVLIISWADNYLGNGKAITAIWELDIAAALNKDSQYRLQEIHDKKERIEQTDKENNGLLDQINRLLGTITKVQSEIYITIPSKEKYLELFSQKWNIDNLSKQEKRNPFTVNIRLNDYLKELNLLTERIEKDRQAYNHFVKEIETVGSLISRLEHESNSAKYDSYPDSSKAREVFQNLTPSYRENYNQLHKKLSQKHQNWNNLLNETEKLNEHVKSAIDILRKDISRRQKTEGYLDEARIKIRSARGWSWNYWISISDSYGINALYEAESAYANWDFDRANRYAEEAFRSAVSAIEEAEDRERTERIRREEKARKEREAAEAAEKAREAAERAREEAAERAREAAEDESWFNGGWEF